MLNYNDVVLILFPMLILHIVFEDVSLYLSSSFSTKTVYCGPDSSDCLEIVVDKTGGKDITPVTSSAKDAETPCLKLPSSSSDSIIPVEKSHSLDNFPLVKEVIEGQKLSPVDSVPSISNQRFKFDHAEGDIVEYDKSTRDLVIRRPDKLDFPSNYPIDKPTKYNGFGDEVKVSHLNPLDRMRWSKEVLDAKMSDPAQNSKVFREAGIVGSASAYVAQTTAPGLSTKQKVVVVSAAVAVDVAKAASCVVS